MHSKCQVLKVKKEKIINFQFSRVSYLGEEKVRDKCSDDDIQPRGVRQCDDLDWTLYYLDVGRMDYN